MTLQSAFAVICCSLPTYKPLLPHRDFLQSWFNSIGSRFSKGGQSTGQSAAKSLSGNSSMEGRHNKYNDLHTDDLDDLVTSTEVVGGKSTSDVGRDYPANAIKMTNTFDVV